MLQHFARKGWVACQATVHSAGERMGGKHHWVGGATRGGGAEDLSKAGQPFRKPGEGSWWQGTSQAEAGKPVEAQFKLTLEELERKKRADGQPYGNVDAPNGEL